MLNYCHAHRGVVNVSALPAAPLKDVSKLRSSILCNLAYVWLGLGDPLQALKPAQELFNLATAPVNLRFVLDSNTKIQTALN